MELSRSACCEFAFRGSETEQVMTVLPLVIHNHSVGDSVALGLFLFSFSLFLFHFSLPLLFLSVCLCLSVSLCLCLSVFLCVCRCLCLSLSRSIDRSRNPSHSVLLFSCLLSQECICLSIIFMHFNVQRCVHRAIWSAKIKAQRKVLTVVGCDRKPSFRLWPRSSLLSIGNRIQYGAATNQSTFGQYSGSCFLTLELDSHKAEGMLIKSIKRQHVRGGGGDTSIFFVLHNGTEMFI